MAGDGVRGEQHRLDDLATLEPLTGRGQVRADRFAPAAVAMALDALRFLEHRRATLRVAREPLGAFDIVAALTGSRPDLAFLSELALDLSPATEGAGRLQRVLGGAADCLSVPRPAPADLASGEPGFHLIGAKAYGRSPAFLLRDGLAHVEMILDHAPL